MELVRDCHSGKVFKYENVPSDASDAATKKVVEKKSVLLDIWWRANEAIKDTTNLQQDTKSVAVVLLIEEPDSVKMVIM